MTTHTISTIALVISIVGLGFSIFNYWKSRHE